MPLLTMGCSSSCKVEEDPSEKVDVVGAKMVKTVVISQKNPSLTCERISWRRGDLIGTGANGRVYLGLEEDTGAIIAVKEVMFTKNACVSSIHSG